MKISSKETTWIITCQAPELDKFASLAQGSGPDGKDVLRLAVDLNNPLEACEERLWPVQAGRAYQLSLSTRSALSRSHGQAYLVWLDAEQKALGEEGSEYTFAKHAFAPLSVCQVAPAKARFARTCFRLVGDSWPDLRGIEGEVWVTAATLQASLAASLSASTAGALYDANETVTLHLNLAGAPAELHQATVSYSLTDYDHQVLGQYTSLVNLNQGSASTSISLPALGVGYYEIGMTVAGEGLASVALTKTFGCLGKLDFNPAQDSPIALDAGLSWPFTKDNPSNIWENLPARFAEQASACYKLGLRSLRDRFSWNEAQPTPDAINWGRYRRAANAQHAVGIDVYQMSSGTPLWSVGPTANAEVPGNYPPADVRLAYSLGQQLAQEMGHVIRFFEWWNEPDIFFYGGHPWDLAAFVKAGTLGVKDTDPTIGILGASRCARPEFWIKWLANGVGPYIDVFNQHSYGKPEDQFALIQQDRDLMAQVGLERPIWMTEMGQRSSPSPDGTYTLAERVQVVYMLRAYASGLAAGLDRFFYFYLQEFLEAGIHLWGLQHQDLSPKPAVLALGALVRQIGQARVVGYLAEDDKYCIVFERQPRDYTAMVWSTKNSIVTTGMNEALPTFEPGQDWMQVDGEFDLPVVKGAQLVDGIGRKVADFTSESAHIKLSLCPAFVRGVDPSRMQLHAPQPALHYAPVQQGLSPERHVWLQAQTRPGQPRMKQADMQAQKNALNTQAGTLEELALTVHNYSSMQTRVAITLTMPEGWQIEQIQAEAGSAATGSAIALELAADSSQVYTVQYRVPALAVGTECGVSASLFLDGAPHDQVAVYYKIV